MRPKLSMWSDYGAPAQRQWMSTSRRGNGSSVGPKILLAAVVVVAGVIGISGIYPQVIDAEWVQDTGTHLPIMSLSTAAAKRVPGTAAAVPSPQRRAATTGQGAGPSPRSASPPEVSRTSVAAAVPSPASTRTGERHCTGERHGTGERHSHSRRRYAGRRGQGRCVAAGSGARSQGGRKAQSGGCEEEGGGASPTRLHRGLCAVWRLGRLGRLGWIWRLPPVLSRRRRRLWPDPRHLVSKCRGRLPIYLSSLLTVDLLTF